MKLENNLSAPLFKLVDIFNREIDLAQYKDKRVFIGFFRHAGCPFCNLRVHALTKVHPELKAKNLEMIFFFESKKEVLIRSIFHKEVSPIPLISDPQKVQYGAYGLEPSALISAKSHVTAIVQTAFKAKMKGLPVHGMADGESINTIPAEFLIDKGLILKKVHYSKNLNDRLDIDILRTFAETGEFW
jgi:thioredoxin-dependent peroxiredoxin